MTTVIRPMVFELANKQDAIPVKVILTWDSRDPFAVSLAFRQRRKATLWWVSRDLLSDGLLFQAGLGDVQVGPDETDEECVLLSLSSPDGAACFRVPADDLGLFLADTFAVTPAGAEVIPDRAFRELIVA